MEKARNKLEKFKLKKLWRKKVEIKYCAKKCKNLEKIKQQKSDKVIKVIFFLKEKKRQYFLNVGEKTK